MKTAAERGEELLDRLSVTSLETPGARALILDALTATARDAVSALDRFLALPEPARGMLLALLADRLDASVGPLADWLEEDGRTAEGAAVRRLTVRPGDLLLVRLSDWRALAAEDAEAMRARLAEIAGVNVAVVIAPEPVSVDAVHPAQMAAAGWVRVEEAARQVEAERAACVAEADRMADDADERPHRHAPSACREIAAAIRARGQAPDDGEAALTAVDEGAPAPAT